jgi:hypothetical protein
MPTTQSKPEPRRYGVQTVRVNASVSQEDVATLKSLGGVSEGVRLLCKQYRQLSEIIPKAINEPTCD